MLVGGIVEPGAGAPGAVVAYVAVSGGPAGSRLFKVEGSAKAPVVSELPSATTVDLGRFDRDAQVELRPAIEAIEAAGGATTTDDPGGGDAPKTNGSAKYYVSIAPVTNNTARPQAEVERIVGGAVRAKFDALGLYQLAPAKESADAARAVMTKRKLKGFYITLSVDKLEYAPDGLKVTVKVVVFNYPSKAMQGMFDKWKLMPGIRPGDKSAEETLIAATAAAAIDTFAQNAASF